MDFIAEVRKAFGDCPIHVTKQIDYLEERLKDPYLAREIAKDPQAFIKAIHHVVKVFKEGRFNIRIWDWVLLTFRRQLETSKEYCGLMHTFDAAEFSTEEATEILASLMLAHGVDVLDEDVVKVIRIVLPKSPPRTGATGLWCVALIFRWPCSQASIRAYKERLSPLLVPTIYFLSITRLGSQLPDQPHHGNR